MEVVRSERPRRKQKHVSKEEVYYLKNRKKRETASERCWTTVSIALFMEPERQKRIEAEKQEKMFKEIDQAEQHGRQEQEDQEF